LIKLGQGVAVSVLQKMGLDLETVRSAVEKQVGTGTETKTAGSIPYTPRVKKVLALAGKEAKTLNHSYVGTGAYSPRPAPGGRRRGRAACSVPWMSTSSARGRKSCASSIRSSPARAGARRRRHRRRVGRRTRGQEGGQDTRAQGLSAAI